ncbi:MAG: lipoyl(octanoyl) transferase LipB [Gammaproteobacteria bacterium]|nr:lipoyl(octanoyl) transferase LipB [Gammaproteobacteria bacterium]
MPAAHPAGPPAVRRLGLADYETVWRDMERFVAERDEHTPDELWLLQHPPVYTRGLNCRMSPLRTSTIPVIQTDRGGQITYHGPGQLIVYALLDIRRRGLGVRRLVNVLEQSVIDLLGRYDITGRRRDKAPGVYVDDRKIAALGVRIRRGSSYHGLSLNIDMDLGPFADIDPCGFEGLEVTQLADLGVQDSVEVVEENLTHALLTLLELDGRG